MFSLTHHQLVDQQLVLPSDPQGQKHPRPVSAAQFLELECFIKSRFPKYFQIRTHKKKKHTHTPKKIMLLRQNTLKPNRKRSMTHLRLLTTVLTPSCNSEVRLQLQKEKGHYVLHQRNEAHVNPTYQSRLSAGCSSTRPRRKEREEKNKVKPGERERTRRCGMSSKKSREDDDDEGVLAALLAVSVSNNPPYFEGSNTHIVLLPRQQSSASAAQETACYNYLHRSEPIMKGKQTVTYTINCSSDPQ